MAFWNVYGISNWSILLTSAAVLLYMYVDWKFKYWRRRGVPSLNALSSLKQLFEIIVKPLHENVLENYKKYGKIHGEYMGIKPQLSVADPVLLKQILVKDFHVFRNRIKMDFIDPLFNKMLGFLQDDDWKRVRCIISPTFTSGRMRKMVYLVKECAKQLTSHCEKIAENKEEIDCKKYYTNFTIDVVAATAFGTKINTLDDPNHPFVQNARKLSSNDASIFVLILLLFPKLLRILKIDAFIGNVLDYFKCFTKHVIEERDKNNIRANDFLQLMLDAQRGNLEPSEEDAKEEHHQLQSIPDHKTMSFDELVAQCILFYIAGGETSSTTLAFLSRYMALHPECQERLLEEIDAAWEDNEEINLDVLNKMDYLDAVICEVLRLQPVAVQLMRIVSSDYELGDTEITLEKDTVVVVPVYAMHRDPEFFPDPEKFDPERFMPDNRPSILPYTYLPFGDGPRNCIGMRFAMMVLKLCAVYVFRKVRMEATENTKKPLQFFKGQGGLNPKQVMVRMIKRTDTTL